MSVNSINDSAHWPLWASTSVEVCATAYGVGADAVARNTDKHAARVGTYLTARAWGLAETWRDAISFAHAWPVAYPWGRKRALAAMARQIEARYGRDEWTARLIAVLKEGLT